MAGVQVESVGAEWLQSHLARKLVRLQFTGMLWLHSHLARKLVRLVYRYVADPGLVLRTHSAGFCRRYMLPYLFEATDAAIHCLGRDVQALGILKAI